MCLIPGRLLTAVESLLQHDLLESCGGLENMELLSELLPRLQPCSTCSLHRTITDLPVADIKALVSFQSLLNQLPCKWDEVVCQCLWTYEVMGQDILGWHYLCSQVCTTIVDVLNALIYLSSCSMDSQSDGKCYMNELTRVLLVYQHLNTHLDCLTSQWHCKQ